MSTKPQYFAYCFLFTLIGSLVLGSVMRRVDIRPAWSAMPHSDGALFCFDGNTENNTVDNGGGKALRSSNCRKSVIREVSAYNSVPDQADSDPCVSADGTDICERHRKGECIVAANAYPLRTRLRIDKVGDCTVADRTHAKYAHRVDLFMDKDIQGAIRFGVKRLVVIEIKEDTQPDLP